MGGNSVWAYLVGSILTSGLLSALISWRVSLKVARHQAEAQVESARVTADATARAGVHQALETERFRLTSHVARRRLHQFDTLARRFRDEVRLEGDVQDVIESLGSVRLGTMAREIHDAAVCAAAPADRRRVQEVAEEFMSSAMDCVDHVEQTAGAVGAEASAAEALSALAQDLLARLFILEAVVDWAAERRLQVWAPDREPPSAIRPLRAHGIRQRPKPSEGD